MRVKVVCEESTRNFCMGMTNSIFSSCGLIGVANPRSSASHIWELPSMERWCLCLFLLLLASPACSQAKACNSRDLKALQNFSEELSSPIEGWDLSSSSSSDCCNWPGVRCDNSTTLIGRVIGLDLANKSLNGSVSDSLAGLDQLKWLNLSSNSLRGIVPVQLFHLRQLQRLDLSLNQLSGTIPSDSRLPSIQIFNISSNLFHGSQPTLAGSTSLKVIDISYNLFSGHIRSRICNSSSHVRVLRFSKNLFSGDLPVGFGSCSPLSELSLHSTGLRGNLPEDLFKLSSLLRLDLRGNELSGRVSSKISNLSNLVYLDLAFNSFSGPLPASLSNLSKLELLHLDSNFLVGQINVNFTAMSRLRSLDLGSNSFSGSIPSDISGCVELKYLYLANNSFTGEIPDGFKNLASLSFLSLSKNNISNISSALAILQHCANLASLILTHNFWGGEKMPWDGIQGFQSMEVLIIPNCHLSGSIPSWLANSTKLKALDLSWNRLDGTIPQWMGNLNHLFYLDLSNNSLTGAIPDSLTRMTCFISSCISSQETPMPGIAFVIIKNITGRLQYKQAGRFPPSLILSTNMLEGPILRGFGKMKNLHVMDLHMNRLSGTIPKELSDMSNLESLDLSYNNLDGSIPPSLTQLSFLSNFDVAYNNLVGLIPSGGQFSTFPNASFEGNPGLCRNTYPCAPEPPTVPLSNKRKNGDLINGMTVGIGLGIAIGIALDALFDVRRICILFSCGHGAGISPKREYR